MTELSFEEARDELSEIVTKLEAGGTPLEHSLALWERGETLAARCQQWLDGARERIEAARNDASAQPRSPKTPHPEEEER